MDGDVKKILELAGRMTERLKKLEARRALPDGQCKAVCSAANTFRWFRGIQLSLLRAAFDPAYAAELKRMKRSLEDPKLRKEIDRLAQETDDDS